VFITFFTASSLFLNFSLCVDLILLIKYPFTDGSKRVKFYVLGAFIFAFIPAMDLSYHKIQNPIGGQPKFAYSFYFAGFVVFFFTFVFSIILACIKLRQKGLDQEVRYMVVSRHITYMSYTLITGIYQFICSFLIFDIFYDKMLNRDEIAQNIAI
jgi:hypothetical protein